MQNLCNIQGGNKQQMKLEARFIIARKEPLNGKSLV